jgi:hypothetical protein
MNGGLITWRLLANGLRGIPVSEIERAGRRQGHA